MTRHGSTLEVNQDHPLRIVSLLPAATEWIEPLFCGGHWTPQLIQWAGGNDGLGRCGAASRLVQPEELFAMDPEILLIACCGLDADRGSRDAESLHKLPGWNDLSCVRDGQLFIFDGSAWFNRSGPRLVDALEAISGLVTKWQGR